MLAQRILYCILADDWNLAEKSGYWQPQKALEILHFDYDVEAFFTVDVVPSRDLHLFNRTLDTAATIRVRYITLSSLDFYYLSLQYPHIVTARILSDIECFFSNRMFIMYLHSYK